MKIIAEIGWNHMGDMDLAKVMINSAIDSGANVVKFQYWNPEYLTQGDWDTDGRRQIYEKAALDIERVTELNSFVTNAGCEFLISVFGTYGANDIHSIGLKNIKIPSHETTNLKLIDFCANNFEYVYFSAGASLEKEVIDAVNILQRGSAEYELMHCVSSYPLPDERANLLRINWLKGLSPKVGLSDHTTSTIIPAFSVLQGVSTIEKHFTTDHDLPGRDNKFALEPKEFKEMVDNISLAESSISDFGNDYQDIESDTVNNYRGRWEPHDYE
jgi:sialic acid synthase SpsE